MATQTAVRNVVVQKVDATVVGRTLDTSDRCQINDCGAQAWVEVDFTPASENKAAKSLTFCGHHFTQNEQKFTAAGYGFNDQRKRILAEA